MIPVGAAEIAARAGMTVAILAGTIAAKRRDWDRLAKNWTMSGWNTSEFDTEVTDTFTAVSRGPVHPLLASMLQVGRITMAADADLDIAQTQLALKVADAWADRYAREVTKELGSTNRSVIESMLPDWLARRLPAAQIAARAKEIYGLDPRSAIAFTRYAESDAKKKNLGGVVDRYLENRATVAGSIHSFTALNTGRQMLVSEGIAQGFLKRDARKVWVTAIDERVCDTCGPMDGVAVPLLGSFTVTYPAPRTERGKKRPAVKLVTPPVHPNCRCTFVLDKKFTDGIITRTARFSERGPDRLARLTSRAADLILQG